MRPDEAGADRMQTIVWREGDEICLRMRRRKNKPNGSGTLRRKCTCAGNAATCAVHTLWDRYFESLENGAMPWAGITPGGARTHLRQTLRQLGVPDAGSYGTHDFRRGHADVRSASCYGASAYQNRFVIRTCADLVALLHRSCWRVNGEASPS